MLNAIETFFNKTYILTRYLLKTELSELQRNYVGTVTRRGVDKEKHAMVDVEVAVERFAIKITDFEDRGDYWYVTYRPALKSTGSFGFGCTRIYKNRSIRPWYNQTNITEYDYNKNYEQNTSIENIEAEVAV